MFTKSLSRVQVGLLFLTGVLQGRGGGGGSGGMTEDKRNFGSPRLDNSVRWVAKSVVVKDVLPVRKRISKLL